MRKCVVVSLVLMLVFSLVFGNVSISFSQKKYNEAPMLAELVKAGKLPPVEQRLPKFPLVLQVKEIGKYGGTIRTQYRIVTQWHEVGSLVNWPTLLKISPKDYRTVIPNIIRAWKFSNDYKSITLYLREGMKWSDGQPFTADDIIFWYEDVILNNELTPVKPADFSPGGKLMKVEKIDPYTVRFIFETSYPVILYILTDSYPYLPKHYLMKYHPKYTPLKDLEKMAKEEKFEYWWQLFNKKVSDVGIGGLSATREVNAPTLSAYVVKSRTPTMVTLERNPYYWKVDQAGNQLPYIDKIQAFFVESPEVYNMRILSGQVDFADFNTDLNNYPVYKDGEVKGGYRVLLWPTPYGSGVAFMPNLNHKDPVLRKIFQDRRFRIALSLAINRDEINQVVYLGLGTPMQATVTPPTSPLYKKEYAEAYAKYDPKTANKLLDEMGLRRGPDGIRLRPDGKPLEITIEYDDTTFVFMRRSTCELVKKYWEDLGIKVALKSEPKEFYIQRVGAAEHDIGLWQLESAEVFLFRSCRDFVPIQPVWSQWGTLWAVWYTTGGKGGEEPPEEIKRLYRLLDIARTSIESARRLKALDEILASQAKNLWNIGTVGLYPKPVIINKNLANVPESVYFYWSYHFGSIANPETWFYKE